MKIVMLYEDDMQADGDWSWGIIEIRGRGECQISLAHHPSSILSFIVSLDKSKTYASLRTGSSIKTTIDDQAACRMSKDLTFARQQIRLLGTQAKRKLRRGPWCCGYWSKRIDLESQALTSSEANCWLWWKLSRESGRERKASNLQTSFGLVEPPGLLGRYFCRPGARFWSFKAGNKNFSWIGSSIYALRQTIKWELENATTLISKTSANRSKRTSQARTVSRIECMLS